jgi:hypothetical protein
MKITKGQLRRIIREQLGTPSQNLPPYEPEFVEGEDEPAGYIVVRDSHDKIVIATAPIVRTDGPDRPFLVRTTDTRWSVPFGIVRAVYPGVEDVFNWVDSKENWENLGPGDRGEVGLYEWEWIE